MQQLRTPSSPSIMELSSAEVVGLGGVADGKVRTGTFLLCTLRSRLSPALPGRVLASIMTPTCSGPVNPTKLLSWTSVGHNKSHAAGHFHSTIDNIISVLIL